MGEGAPFRPHPAPHPSPQPMPQAHRALRAGSSVPEDRAELRRHTKRHKHRREATHCVDTTLDSWTKASGPAPADKRGSTRPHTDPLHTDTSSHTSHTETYIHADKHSSTHEPAALMLSPEPLTWASTMPLGWSSPLPRGGQQAGAGEGAPESQAKLPLIRAGRGGAPTSERGLPGGGHLRTSPPTHAAVWAPSPTSPAPPSFRQLRPASPHPTPHPCGNAWGGGAGEGEYRGEFSQDLGGRESKGSVEMLFEPGGSSAADAPFRYRPPTHSPDLIPLLSPCLPSAFSSPPQSLRGAL